MLETFEDRVSSIESRVSRIESRGSRNKAFSNMQKLERVSRKQFISRRKNNTVLLTPKVQMFRVDRYRMKTFDHTVYDSGLNVIFFLRQLVFKTKCRTAVDDGNLLVNADKPLRSKPFAKFLK